MLAVSGDARVAVALLGVAALVGAFVDHFGAILRGYERFADEARLNASRALLTVLAGLTALTLSRSLAGVCAGLAVANLGSGIFGWIALRRWHPMRAASTSAKADGALARRALRESLPLWLAGLLSVLYFKVDTLFLRALAGDGELGAYGAAYKFFEGAMMVPAVVLAVAFPQLARAHGDRVVQRRLERQVGGLLLALGLLGGALFLSGGATLVRVIFGADFGRAIASLRVLALGVPLVFVNYGLTHFLVARDIGRVTMWLALMMLVITVALDLALIPQLSGPGAAWATVLAEIALTVCCLVALKPRAASAEAPQLWVNASAALSEAASEPPVVSPLQATSTPIARVAKRSQNR
jgi:O-antigen/teichoic acid export membrane protein